MGFDSLFILLALLLAALIVLPIIALVKTARISQLEKRLEGVEAALRRMMREVEAVRAGGVASPEMTQRAAPAIRFHATLSRKGL